MRKLIALLLTVSMLMSFGVVAFAAQEGETETAGTRIDILTFADFHGMVDAEIISMDDADPGAARFVAFAEYLRQQNPNPDNVMIVPGGDDYHGHPLSNFLLGQPAIYMMRELGVRYAVLGNHEFSFGYERAMELVNEFQFLAADLFYGEEHPDEALRGTRPSWIQPYAVVEFEDGDIKVGLVGLMTMYMSGLVPAVFGEDTVFERRTPTIPGAPAEWTAAIEGYIYRLRNHYGVDAVIGVTHMGVTTIGNTNLAEGRENLGFEIGGGEAYLLANLVTGFDAILGGHHHTRATSVINGTPIILGGWHGRNMGRISLYFDEDGDLYDVTLWLNQIHQIRDMELPEDPADPIRAAYDRMAAHIDRLWGTTVGGVTPRDHLLAPIGTRGIYSMVRADRDVWATRLVLDYVKANAQVGDNNETFADWVYISNAGGWRNVAPFEFGPDTPVHRGHMYGTMPFNNAIILLEMHGRDLVTLLSMQSSTVAAGPEFGLGGASGPLGGAVVSGAFRGAQLDDYEINGVYRPRWEWFNEQTGVRISDDMDTIYRVIGSNFILGGGDRFPFPGNAWGELLEMTAVPGTVPLALMSDGTTVPWFEFVAEFPDGTTWEANGLRTLRTAMIAQQEWRGRNPGYTAELNLIVDGGGVAAIASPFAPGNRTRNVNVVPQGVTVTATGGEFFGWYNADGELVSESAEFTFIMHEDTVLTARFAPGPALPFTDIAGHWAIDYIGFVYGRGLMVGIDGGRFAPDATLNRAMIATILWREAGEPGVEFDDMFTDVPDFKWYSDAVIWAYVSGIMGFDGLFEGVPEGFFDPYEAVTRQQFAAIIYRFAYAIGFEVDVPEDHNLDAFSDIGAAGEWALEYLIWANYLGLITGDTAVTISPLGQLTRAQFATIIYRFITL